MSGSFFINSRERSTSGEDLIYAVPCNKDIVRLAVFDLFRQPIYIALAPLVVEVRYLNYLTALEALK